MNTQKHTPYYIRVADVQLFNAIYESVEQKQMIDAIKTRRQDGYYEMFTADVALWRELCLYAQYLAQAQDAFIETGENRE